MILEVACELALPPVHGQHRGCGHRLRRPELHPEDGRHHAGAGGVQHALRHVRGQIRRHRGPGFGANLRRGLYDKIQEFSFADIDRFSSASLITRITNDVNAIQMMVTMALRMLVRAR
mgnify:CR=1 FL=1